MDIYPIAVLLLALLALSTLMSLKAAMRQIMREERSQNQEKRQQLVDRTGKANADKKEKGETCRIFKYMLRQYTFALIFRGRVGTPLLLLLFTYSVVAFYAYFTKFWYPALGFGSLISTLAIITEYLSQKHNNTIRQDEQLNAKKWRLKKVCFASMGIVAVTLYVTLFGLCFRNYINSRLRYMLIDFFIAFSIDNLAVKPFIFLALALITGHNQCMIDVVSKEEMQKEVSRVKVANEHDRPQTKHHFVINLEIEPQPVDMNKSKEFNRSKTIQQQHVPQALPSSSIIDTIQMHHQSSMENMMSRVQSNKTAPNKMTSMKDLNEVQLDKIEQNPGYELQQYFCINLRRSREVEQSKNLQNKIEAINHNNPHIQTSDLIKEFVLEDFLCTSPDKNEEVHQQVKSKYSKSKGSLRGVKTFRILQKQADAHLDEKQNTFAESTRHEISQSQASGYHKQASFCSNTRRTEIKTHILKINGNDKQTGELEEIDINSPNKRIVQKYSDTQAIPEQQLKSKIKNRRRRTTKDISQPYLLQDKLIQVYFPGKNKSDLQNFIRSKKKNFDRSQFFNHSNKKQTIKGRQKPIVHESQQNHAQFFIPKF